MELIELIMSKSNLELAMERVRVNRGAGGVDRMDVDEGIQYFKDHMDEIRQAVIDMKYRPLPVRRVYIPKSNGKMRGLGIPTVVDRIIQQAAALILDRIFDPHFSEFSYGFRRDKSAHKAVFQALEYLNEGYQWVVDLDIEKFFDNVNHDKLISIIRERMNDRAVLHLIRTFLKAGVFENDKVTASEMGTPQGGCISPLLANIYLDKFDKELEQRGLRYVRYADDICVFVKTEMAAERVMKSVSSWLERKLFLKVNPTKTKIVRPGKCTFLGFGFYKAGPKWQARPAEDRKMRLYDKIREVLCRKKAAATPLSVLFTKVNQIVRGWINYFRLGSMKTFMREFGKWLRHKVRVVIMKQWKKPRTIFRNLTTLNRVLKMKFTPEQIRQTANSRLGLYRTAGMITVNYLLSPKVLGMKKKDRPGLVDPLKYYCVTRANLYACKGVAPDTRPVRPVQ